METKILLSPLRLAWRIFSRTATLLLLAVSGVVWLCRLMGLYPKFQTADRVVLMTRPSGFGYSIQGPDMARRLAPEEHILFLVASWRYDYNAEVLKLWRDVKNIEVVFVSRFTFVKQLSEKGRVFLPFLKPHDAMVQWLTRWFVRLACGTRVRVQSLKSLFSEMIEAGEDSASSPDMKPEFKEHSVFISYADLLIQQPAPPLRMPSNIRENFERLFCEAWHASGYKKKPKLCCLYLRYEKPFSQIARLRNGSEFFSVLPAIRLLNAAGYQVALTGDRGMTSEIRQGFGGGLIDDVTINSDRNIYQLYAASEADIFIGNNGGGIVVPTINEIPCLFLDWFPVVDGFNHSWLYFKSASYEDGSPVPYDRFLGEHAFDFTCSFGTMSNNTKEEITEAVESFLQDVKNMDAPDPHADVAALIPQESMFRHSGARISPAWVRRNILGETKKERATI